VEALGRSRCGLSTKIEVIGDGRGRPLVTRLSPGQGADTTRLLGLLDAIRAPRPGGIGRPRVRRDHLVVDKGYSSRTNRAGLRATNIPPPSRSRMTSGRNADSAAGQVAGGPGSTRCGTRRATRSSVASTGASNCARSRPATTSSSAASRPPDRRIDP
jgi:Transposase DDE domain